MEPCSRTLLEVCGPARMGRTRLERANTERLAAGPRAYLVIAGAPSFL